MKSLKISLFILVIFLISCEYKYDMYLEGVKITNSLFESKETIYFECDILGNTIVEIPFNDSFEVPINQLWKNTNPYSYKTMGKIHNEIIRKYNFRIYRYKDAKKQYFSFEKRYLTLIYDGCGFREKIDNVSYVYYDVHAEEQFWE